MLAATPALSDSTCADLRDRQGFVHLAREFAGQAAAFVADEDGERQSSTRSGQRGSLVRRRGEQANASRAQKGNQFGGRNLKKGKRKIEPADPRRTFEL